MSSLLYIAEINRIYIRAGWKVPQKQFTLFFYPALSFPHTRARHKTFFVATVTSQQRTSSTIYTWQFGPCCLARLSGRHRRYLIWLIAAESTERAASFYLPSLRSVGQTAQMLGHRRSVAQMLCDRHKAQYGYRTLDWWTLIYCVHM